jgi:Rieske Fe-S protein
MVSPDSSRDAGSAGVDRRTALTGAGVAATALTLAACSSNTSSAPTASAAPAQQQGPAGALTQTGAVPVGGGVIVGDTVITQPTAGTYQGFSSTCPHLGCKVNQVSGGLILCPCHGSEFRLDGSVARGPAERGLDPHPVRVEGSQIVSA